MAKFKGEYDIENPEEVILMGKHVGTTLMDSMKEMVMAMDQTQRILFYTALLSVQGGCMGASIGIEATRAVLDTVKEQTEHVAATKKAEAH